MEFLYCVLLVYGVKSIQNHFRRRRSSDRVLSVCELEVCPWMEFGFRGAGEKA